KRINKLWGEVGGNYLLSSTCRKITDFYFIFIYIIAIIILITIGIYAHINGNPQRLIHPINSHGQVCLTNGTYNKSNLLILDYQNINYFNSLSSLIFRQKLIVSSSSICIQDCPTYLGKPNATSCSCQVEIQNETHLATEINNKNCAGYNIPTFSLMNYCIPDFKTMYQSNITFKDMVKNIGENNLIQVLEDAPQVLSKVKIVMDIYDEFYTIRRYIPFFGLYPMFISLYIVALLISIGGLSYFSIRYSGQDITITSSEKLQWIKYQFDTILKANESSTLLLSVVICAIISFIILCFGCCINKVIKTLCIYAKEVSNSNISIIMIISASFIILWSVFITRGISIYLISYSYYQYYWKKKYVINLSLYFSIFKGLRSIIAFNLGSIIFGAFLMTIITILALVLRLLLKLVGAENKERTKSYARTFLIELFNIFFLMFGSIVVCAATSLLCYYHLHLYQPKLTFSLFISIIIGGISIIVSFSIMSIYTIGITTIHYCYFHYEAQ
ncbi:hypothetical protein HZS_8164, partial [Henneguya salminicola]